ncbi:hypothetical protein BZA77DRAFT_355473 [Pyronema omphalodes]|nr:hypothetical protein BZA77DRAFT_355473 [Pyronema omphalodes]
MDQPNNSPRNQKKPSPKETFNSVYGFDQHEETEMILSDDMFDCYSPLDHAALHIHRLSKAEISTPEIEAPEISTLEIEAPEIEAPEISSSSSSSSSDYDTSSPNLPDISPFRITSPTSPKSPSHPLSPSPPPPAISPRYTPPRPRHFSSPRPLVHRTSYTCGFPLCQPRSQSRGRPRPRPSLQHPTKESLSQHYLHEHATLECQKQATQKCQRAPWQRIVVVYVPSNQTAQQNHTAPPEQEQEQVQEENRITGQEEEQEENRIMGQEQEQEGKEMRMRMRIPEKGPPTVGLNCGCLTGFDWSDHEAVRGLNRWILCGDVVAYERGDDGWREWRVVKRDRDRQKMMGGRFGGYRKGKREVMGDRLRERGVDMKPVRGDKQREFDRASITKVDERLDRIHEEMEQYVVGRREGLGEMEIKRRSYKFQFPGLL